MAQQEGPPGTTGGCCSIASVFPRDASAPTIQTHPSGNTPLVFLQHIVACLYHPAVGCWLKMEKEGMVCLGVCWQPALRAPTCLSRGKGKLRHS